MRRFPFLLVLLGAACASRGASVPPLESPSTAPAELVLERPIPYPVDVPSSYLDAVERGTRTAAGAPGPRYWQQWAEYDVRVRLDTGRRRVDGSTDRKSTRLNSSHSQISYAVFC